MTDAPSIYPDWKAPAQDGEVLIWPEPATLQQQTLANQKRVTAADSVLIQNVPLPKLRQLMRGFLGQSKDAPIIASGHQAELYHAGVWVKDVLIDRLATVLNGQAMHFAVDTDSPKHLQLRWPEFATPITDDPKLSTKAWCQLIAPPTPKHLSEIDDAARRAGFSDDSPMVQFLQSMRRLSIEPDEFPAMLTNAQHQLDWSLGLRHHAFTVSPILRSDGYLAFVHHIMSRPREFAGSYNAALAEYRAQAGIRSTMRPMPDLFVSDESIESPFWLDDLSQGSRSRPSVFRAGDGWLLELVSGEEFHFDPGIDALAAATELRGFLTRTNHRLSSRALTLTIFLRLFVADQFVHGIGGARYDQVADRIIASHFKIAPPSFSVTTATMFYPGATDRERVCMPCLLQQEHRLEHSVLGHRKSQIVEEIEKLPRRSAQRRELFLAMHRDRRAALTTSGNYRQFEESLRQAQTQLQEEQVLFDRELFYAVQTRTRLEQLIERCKEAFSR